MREFGRRYRLLLLAATLFALIFALRVQDPHPADAILVLCVIPVVICAIDRGPIGGVLASLVGLGLTVAWELAGESEVSVVGYLSRAIAFAIVGIVVGRFAAERRASERRLARSSDIAVDLQCIAGFDGYFKRVNPAWSELLGYSDHELLARPFVDHVHPDDLQRTIRETERLVDGGLPLSFENRYRKSDGSYRWLSWTARSVPDEGLIYATARDITEQRDQREALERLVAERTADLEAARVEALQRLALAAEYRDDNTQQHTERVGTLAAKLAERLGFAGEFVDHMRLAAPLHDIGKLGVPDGILLKPGRLTAQERAQMETHTSMGAAILSGSAFPVLQLGEAIALSHHERWDGDGYPTGLSGEDIPLAARIVAVADVFDALTHERPYKPAWPLHKAASTILAGAGTQFDPEVVEAFDGLWRGGELAAILGEADAPELHGVAGLAHAGGAVREGGRRASSARSGNTSAGRARRSPSP